MRHDKGGEKREEGVSDRLNRRNKVDRSIVERLNCAICNCGYGTDEKQNHKHSEHEKYNNFQTGNMKLRLHGIVEIIFRMKECEMERRIYDESEKDRQEEEGRKGAEMKRVRSHYERS